MARSHAGLTCPRCSAAVEPGSSFCTNCGCLLGEPGPVADTTGTTGRGDGSAWCQFCGAALTDDSVFCPSCGARIVGDQAQTLHGHASHQTQEEVESLSPTAKLFDEQPVPVVDATLETSAFEAARPIDVYQTDDMQPVVPAVKDHSNTVFAVCGAIITACIIALVVVFIVLPKTSGESEATEATEAMTAVPATIETVDGATEDVQAPAEQTPADQTAGAQTAGAQTVVVEQPSETSQQTASQQTASSTPAPAAQQTQAQQTASSAPAPASQQATPQETASSAPAPEAQQTQAQPQEQSGPPTFADVTASSTLKPDHITSYYGPLNAVDDNLLTAWNEGADGGGVGEWIRLEASGGQHVHGVRLVGGYTKSEEIYYKNNRPRVVTVTLSDGYQQTFEMADDYGSWQTIDFGGEHETTYVQVTIESIYGGTTWNDCSFTELSAY